MSKQTYEQYEHHDVKVWVNSELKGQHRNMCLCYDCAKFHPTKPALHCQMAAKIYERCVKWSLVTPVMECPQFKELSIMDKAIQLKEQKDATSKEDDPNANGNTETE